MYELFWAGEPHTVRKYIRLGLLKGIRHKGRWLVTREDFEAFKQERGIKG